MPVRSSALNCGSLFWMYELGNQVYTGNEVDRRGLARTAHCRPRSLRAVRGFDRRRRAAVGAVRRRCGVAVEARVAAALRIILTLEALGTRP